MFYYHTFCNSNNSNSNRSESTANSHRQNNISNNANENKKLIKCKNGIFSKFFAIIFYIFFGHIFISEKIYFKTWNNYFVSGSILLFEFSYFFLQVYINILMMFPYFIKEGICFYIYEFINGLDYFHEITISVYYSLLILFIGSFLLAERIICDFLEYKSKIVKILCLFFGILLSFIFLPLHIIINPILLMYFIIKNECNCFNFISDIKEFANYVNDKLIV